MRFWILCLVSLSLSGCGLTGSTSGQLKVESGILQATGIIKAREILDLKTIEVSTEAASVDGKSFGLEYLASGEGYKSSTAIRYDIELLEGSLVSVYSESWRYRVDDCVSVIINLDDNKTPPVIFLNNNDC
ncbi:MAG: hypothetical protein ACERLB_07960 [Gammaproteobacteria bacterium]